MGVCCFIVFCRSDIGDYCGGVGRVNGDCRSDFGVSCGGGGGDCRGESRSSNVLNLLPPGRAAGEHAPAPPAPGQHGPVLPVPPGRAQTLQEAAEGGGQASGALQVLLLDSIVLTRLTRLTIMTIMTIVTIKYWTL